MWPFGNSFPYTNFHDMNLDWIINVVKEISEADAQFAEDLKKKLNAPLAPGQAGDILTLLADGSTGWTDLGSAQQQAIIDAVNAWLAAHPEATTTVQDDSITMAKFTDQVKYNISRKESGLLAPAYIGDYIISENYLPSAALINNGKVVCVNAPQDAYAISQGSGFGIVSVFDLATNAKLADYNINVGHGNSIAFDGAYFYIAPVWEYTANGRTNTTKVYQYSTSFVLIAELVAPAQIMGLSYDQETSTLYALDYSGNIYYYDNNAFIPYTVIDNWATYYTHENILSNTTYFQDIAINDNQFYVSSPQGNILHGMLAPANCEITDFMQVMRTDTTGRFILGELEGYEFTDGHLYGIMYTIIPSGLENAFVVEFPVNMTACTSPLMDGTFAVKDATLTLSDATVAAFSLKTYEIRSINQLPVRRINNFAVNIEIQAGSDITEDYDIVLPAQAITLSLYGYYTCKRFIVSSGEFNLYVPVNTHKLTITDTSCCFELRRAGSMKFSGNYSLNLQVPNLAEASGNLVGIGWWMSQTITRISITPTPAIKLYVGSAIYHTYEEYIGATPFNYMTDTFTLKYADGFITQSATEVKLYFRMPKLIRDANYNLAGTLTIRGIQGYLDNEFNPVDISGYTITKTKLDDFTLELTIKHSDSAAFTNTVNNTPVCAIGSITFTHQ